MFTIVEPQWGVNLLMHLNAWMMNNPTLIHRIPKLADFFVFTYPVYLVILYFRGFKNSFISLNPSSKEGLQIPTLKGSPPFDKGHKVTEGKIAALFIGFSVLLTVFVNLLIQYVFDKVRPDIVLGLANNKTDSILHKFLPTSSFPSDHAAVSMSIAMATLLWGIAKKDRRFVWISIPLFAFSLIMSFCRVTAAIHRPTDIIAGSIVGILVPLAVMKFFTFQPSSKEGSGLEKIFSRIGKII